MVPNLRPKSEKGLEEEESWDDELEESPEDSPTMDLEASKVEPDLSPITEAEVTTDAPTKRGLKPPFCVSICTL